MKKNIVVLYVMLALFGIEYAEEYAFIGQHYIASYRGCDPDALRDLVRLREKMIEASNASGATVLATSDFVFEPDGMTMVLLLSESHASIHTYPEYEACFIDLFTCGTSCSAEAFAKVLKSYLHPIHFNENIFHRD